MTFARPRPPTMIARVATIGCRPSLATRLPAMKPATAPKATPIRIAGIVP